MPQEEPWPTGDVDKVFSVADVGKHIVPGALCAEGVTPRQLDGRQPFWVRHRVGIQRDTITTPRLEVRVPAHCARSLLASQRNIGWVRLQVGIMAHSISGDGGHLYK